MQKQNSFQWHFKKVNNTSPRLPEKHIESEQLFRNCDCETFLCRSLNHEV